MTFYLIFSARSLLVGGDENRLNHSSNSDIPSLGPLYGMRPNAPTCQRQSGSCPRDSDVTASQSADSSVPSVQQEPLEQPDATVTARLSPVTLTTTVAAPLSPAASGTPAALTPLDLALPARLAPGLVRVRESWYFEPSAPPLVDIKVGGYRWYCGSGYPRICILVAESKMSGHS